MLNLHKKNANYFELTPEEYELIHGWEPRTPNQRVMAGLFQPLADMFKDLKNTFKPYKGTYQSNADFLQPIYGIGNLLLSALQLCVWVLETAFTPIALLITSSAMAYNFLFNENNQDNKQKWTDFASKAIFACILTLIHIITLALRGITQLVFTPLTWLIKMPLRGLITLIVGSPKIEESESVQRLLKMGEDELNKVEDMYNADTPSICAISKALSIKLSNGCVKGASTNLTDDQKSEIYDTADQIRRHSLISKKTMRIYFSLFSPKNETITNEEKSINYTI